MRVKLYVIMGSHACRSAMLMLDFKGIPFQLVQLPAGMHSMGLALAGFAGSGDAARKVDGTKRRMMELGDHLGTVPALRYGEERVMTNHDIARFLEKQQPEPPLFPADPGRRERVEEAEAWGDEILQMTARRLALVAGGAGKMIDGGSVGRLGPLLFANPHVRRTATKLFSRVFSASARDEPALLAESRELLERVDTYIAEGVLGSEELNVADFAIAPSVALLAYHRELAAEIEDGPAGQMLDRVFAVADSQPGSPQPTA